MPRKEKNKQLGIMAPSSPWLEDNAHLALNLAVSFLMVPERLPVVQNKHKTLGLVPISSVGQLDRINWVLNVIKNKSPC